MSLIVKAEVPKGDSAFLAFSGNCEKTRLTSPKDTFMLFPRAKWIKCRIFRTKKEGCIIV